MIDLKAGDIVLVEGAFHNSYGLGRVYGTPTPKTVMLQAWDNDYKEWVDRSRRARDSVKAILPPDIDVEAFRTFVLLRRSTMTEEIKKAEQRFHEAVKHRIEVLGVAKR